MSRDALVGIDQLVPLFDGRLVPYVNLDNAASTPAFRSVVETIEEFLPFYSGVHRGTGYKSRVSTTAFERARELVGEFLGADPERDVVVFTKNTTEAINRLARSLAVADDAVVLTTMLEHHSNDLPWRGRFRTVHVGLGPDGALDIDDLDRCLAEHAGHIALLAVSGASNVTGVVQPVHELAEKVHAAGGRILVDAAQLAPHRPIDMRPHDDPGHLDFVALSAHKMYAPYGTGALVGARVRVRSRTRPRGRRHGARRHDRLPSSGPTFPIGRRRAVRTSSARSPWRQPSARSPRSGSTASPPTNASSRDTRWIGCEVCPASPFTARPRASGPTDKVGVVPFTIAGIDHGLIAAVLGYEHGVAVRNGCFCAHPYIAHLLDLSPADSRAWVEQAKHDDKRGAPGMVRISFGCYNDRHDVDVAVRGLEQIVAGEFAADYRADVDGSFHPAGYVEPLLFSLDAR